MSDKDRIDSGGLLDDSFFDNDPPVEQETDQSVPDTTEDQEGAEQTQQPEQPEPVGETGPTPEQREASFDPDEYKRKFELYEKRIDDKDEFIETLKAEKRQMEEAMRSIYERQQGRQPDVRNDDDDSIYDQIFENPKLLKKEFVQRRDFDQVNQYMSAMGQHLQKQQRQLDIQAFFMDHPDALSLRESMHHILNEKPYLAQGPNAYAQLQALYEFASAQKQSMENRPPAPPPVNPESRVNASTTSTSAPSSAKRKQAPPNFHKMTEKEIEEWVENNGGGVNY